MIEKYEIRVINGERQLFLFLNLNYEFGGNKKKKNTLKKEISSYLKKNRINFSGGIITFVVGSVLIGSVVFNNNEFKDYKPIDNYVSNMIVEKLANYNEKVSTQNDVIEETTITNVENEPNIKIEKENVSNVANNLSKKESIANKSVVKEDNSVNNNVEPPKNESNISTDNVQTSENEQNIEEDNNIYVNLKKKDGSIIRIELEEYLVGVVGAEMPALFNVEALKSQAIIARTYALKNTLKGNVLRDNESNQSYKTNEELKSLWGGNYNNYYNKVKKAVNETTGTILKYNGTYIEAVYHSTSNGMTESSVNVWGNYYPYLVSVSSEYDKLNVSFEVSKELTFEEISNKLGFEINKDTKIELNGRTSGNRVESITIGENTYKGIDFRNILGLRSADFDVEITDLGIKFTTRGYGHGVGLSQYGANGMAKNGYNYEEILKHYYPGVVLEKLS